MKSKVAIYETHEQAMTALKHMSDAGFSMKHVSLLGNAQIIDNHVHVIHLNWLKDIPVLLGILTTTVIGILEGMKVIDLSGLHILYGAGAFVGTIAGLYTGIILGGISWMIVTSIIKKNSIIKMRERLKYGSFYIMVNGTPEEVERAEHILHKEGSHKDII